MTGLIYGFVVIVEWVTALAGVGGYFFCFFLSRNSFCDATIKDSGCMIVFFLV